MTPQPKLRISRLVETNFMRIEELDITPGSTALIILKGDNEQGKTSAIQAIISALSGKRADPPVPIRAGQKATTVELTLAHGLSPRYQVSVSWTEKGRYLTVKDVSSSPPAKISAGQTLLASLVGDVSYNPLAFMHAKPADRFPLLMQAAGCADEYKTLQGQRSTIQDSRRGHSAIIRELASQLKATPDPSPDEKLASQSIDHVNTQIAGVSEFNTELQTKWGQLHTHQAETKTFDTKISDDRILITQLHSQIRDLESRIEINHKQVSDRTATAEKFQKQLSEIKPRSVEVLQKQAVTIQAHNEMVAKQQHARLLKTRIVDHETKIDEYNMQLDAITANATNLLAESAVGKNVPGLIVSTEGDILHDGLPIEQASGMRQLELSTLIGMAANPQVGVMLIDEGDRLDPSSIERLRKIADANGFQIWMTAIYAQASDACKIVDVVNGRAGSKVMPSKDDPVVGEMYDA